MVYLFFAEALIAMVEDAYRIEDILVVSWKRYLEELVEKFL